MTSFQPRKHTPKAQQGLAGRLYLMLAVAILPLLAANAYQSFIAWQTSRKLDRAFLEYDLASQAKTAYRLFVDAATDAADTGSLNDKGAEALNQTYTFYKRLRGLADDSSTSADQDLEKIHEAVSKSHEFTVLMNLRVPIHDFDTALDESIKTGQGQLDAVVQGSVAGASVNALAMATISLVSAVIAVLIGVRLIRSLTRRMRAAAQAAERIAQGILDHAIEVDVHDEAGQLLLSIQKMQNALTEVIAEIRVAVSAAAAGDFSQRVQLEGRQGFGLEIGKALNALNEDLQRGIGGTPAYARDVALRIAGGDLSVQVEVTAGDEQSLLAAMAMMRSSLEDVVTQVRKVVDAAARGDFSQKMNVAASSGYAYTLAELLNSLMRTAHDGLSDILRVAGALADGDLTQTIVKEYPGLFGQTRAGINATVANLQSLISEIAAAVETINAASGDIVNGNDDLERRTEEQLAALSQTTVNMNAVAERVRQNAGDAQQADQLAARASEVANSGGQVVAGSVVTMEEIASSSRKISEITSLIDGIAFQTNILALNAAVEAARAGEHGRGFAVVAGEVRSLASRAATAAREINALIKESSGKVSGGLQQIKDAGQTMEAIVDATSQVSRLMAQIRSAAAAQGEGIEQVDHAMTSMQQSTGSNATLVREAAQAAQSLRGEAGRLQELVAGFRLVRGADMAERTELHGIRRDAA